MKKNYAVSVATLIQCSIELTVTRNFMVSRDALQKSFSQRLNSLLVERGYAKSTQAGVSATPIAKAIGCSQQMARKYTLGECFPECVNVMKLAEWLGVDPGWLIFGTNRNSEQGDTSINITALKLILEHSQELINDPNQEYDYDRFANFQSDLIENISKIDVDEQSVKNIVRASISGAKFAGGFAKKIAGNVD